MLHLLIASVLLLLGSAALFLFRKRLGLFLSVGGFYLLTVFYMAFGFDPPAPASVFKLFTGTSFLAVLLYITSSEAALEDFWGPIRSIIVNPSRKPVLIALLVGLPGLVAWQAMEAARPSEDPPPKVRSVHPSPPSTIEFTAPGSSEAKTIDLLKGDNPLRALEESDPAAFTEAVVRGKVVYYENCYYCHGDDLAADGHYANAFSPPPANFQDPGVIPMLQETFLFWRIAKGGPGLPDAGTPWDSSMPVWEKMLSADEIWSVILFLSDYTGYKPRGREEHEGAH